MRTRTLLRGVLAVWLASIAIVAVMTLPARSGRPDDPPRQFEWSGDAAGVELLEVRGSAGAFRLTSGDGDSIRVRVSVRGDSWKPTSLFARSNPADLSRARLETRSGDRALALELETGSNGRVIEEWSVEMPARLGAKVLAGNGEIEVRGITGGVEARANAGHGSKPGHIQVDVPSGSVTAALSVGTVEVRTTGTNLGEVRLSSGVGNTQLWIDGHRLKRRDPPGPGSEVELTGEGADEISARVKVGDAIVRIR